MKSIALIHTVKTVANSFEQQLKDYVGEPVKIHNLWDDFLANNPNEIGEFTIENRCRLYNDIKSAEMTGADMIVVTCSTLTPVVNMIRPFIKVPLIAIDDAMDYVKTHPNYRIPAHLMDAHYKSAAKLGHGIGYQYSHDYENHYVRQQYLPDEIADRQFYEPSDNGYEQNIKQYFKNPSIFFIYRRTVMKRKLSSI